MILAMTYGYEVQGHDDRKIVVSRQLMRMSAETPTPRDLLVNGIPSCLFSSLYPHSVYFLLTMVSFSAAHPRMVTMV